MSEKKGREYFWGVLAVFVFVFIVTIAIYCFCYYRKSGFSDLSEQPMEFKNQYLNIPSPGSFGCKPYSGCFYPTNPMNLINSSSKSVDDIWCEKAWRDCNAYQDCVEGKCVPKKGLYNNI